MRTAAGRPPTLEADTLETTRSRGASRPLSSHHFARWSSRLIPTVSPRATTRTLSAAARTARAASSRPPPGRRRAGRGSRLVAATSTTTKR